MPVVSLSFTTLLRLNLFVSCAHFDNIVFRFSSGKDGRSELVCVFVYLYLRTGTGTPSILLNKLSLLLSVTTLIERIILNVLVTSDQLTHK